MRETNKSRQAFNDYFEMGPGRSLRKLHQIYIQPASESPPTIHLRTLLEWSRVHGWQERIAKQEAEIAAARMQAIIDEAPHTGYAVWQKRVHDLGELAEYLEEGCRMPGLFSPQLVREFRGLLADIAAEMGERKRSVALTGEDGGPIVIRHGAEPNTLLWLERLTHRSVESIKRGESHQLAGGGQEMAEE